MNDKPLSQTEARMLVDWLKTSPKAVGLPANPAMFWRMRPTEIAKKFKQHGIEVGDVMSAIRRQ